jgi:lectin, mannose-binding 2
LTGDRPSQAGWIFSRLPITATNFEVLPHRPLDLLTKIIFEFKIHGKGAGVYGDGMAMWLTKQRAQTGTVFGCIDNFEGLGIFIDTYKNSRPGVSFPYVMAMLGDGQTSYDNDHDGQANEIGGCSVCLCREGLM